MKIIPMLCDICGANCKKDERQCDNEYATFEATWGYDSKRDLLQMKLIMCEDCSFLVEDFIKRIGGKFKYNEFFPPQVFEGKLAKFYEDKDNENYSNRRSQETIEKSAR